MEAVLGEAGCIETRRDEHRYNPYDNKHSNQLYERESARSTGCCATYTTHRITLMASAVRRRCLLGSEGLAVWDRLVFETTSPKPQPLKETLKDSRGSLVVERGGSQGAERRAVLAVQSSDVTPTAFAPSDPQGRPKAPLWTALAFL